MSPIEVKNLKKYFKTPAGDLHAVDNVSFNIEKGKTFAAELDRVLMEADREILSPLTAKEQETLMNLLSKI